MRKIDFRVLIGGALILLGGLMLLERFGLFQGAASIFWGIVFLVGGGYFLYRFASNSRSEWWTAFPGFVLLGLSAAALLTPFFPGWGGFFFLGFLGLGFFAVYFTNRDFWWALIPGGVLVTLGFVSVVAEVFAGRETGGLFFLGLGLTFLLVAVLASMQWAYIPGVILLVLGAFIGTPFAGSLNYVWPTALILGGLLLIFQFVRKK